MNGKAKAMKRRMVGLLIAGILGTGAALGTVAYAAGEHSHGHADAAHALKLNDGRKWASDEPLRESMAKIRDAVDAKLPAVHRGELAAAQYDALGVEIEAQVAHIVQNCKLDPQADEVLHAILAELLEGNEKLRGRDAKTERSAGVVQVVRSLGQYAKYFEHAGFEAPNAGH